MSHSVRRSVCVWKFCYHPPYIHGRSLLAHSALFVYVSISLSVKGQHPPSCMAPCSREKDILEFQQCLCQSYLYLSLICYLSLTVLCLTCLNIFFGGDRSSSFFFRQKLCHTLSGYLGVDSVRTLSVYVSSLVSIYVISCLCVVRNFDFCLALACVYFMSNLSCVNLTCLAL